MTKCFFDILRFCIFNLILLYCNRLDNCDLISNFIILFSYICVFSNTESVRDVQFCPQQPHTFAAVSENGHVQQWDMRKPDRYFQHFTAHSGPIFACDWHPEATWLATASRDKTIKAYFYINI